MLIRLAGSLFSSEYHASPSWLAAAARLRDAEARWGDERQKLRHENEVLPHAVEVLAHLVRDLHEELVRLQREQAAGNVTPIRFQRPPF